MKEKKEKGEKKIEPKSYNLAGHKRTSKGGKMSNVARYLFCFVARIYKAFPSFNRDRNETGGKI